MAWKKIRCVIELPINGDVSEKDLVWSVKLSLDETKIKQRLGGKPTGKLEIKEFNRVTRNIF